MNITLTSNPVVVASILRAAADRELKNFDRGTICSMRLTEICDTAEALIADARTLAGSDWRDADMQRRISDYRATVADAAA